MIDWRASFKSGAAALARMPGRVLFPPICAGCRRLVSEPGALCAQCWSKLTLLEPPWCPVLGTPFAHDMGDGFVSAPAIASPPPYARARAAVAYTGVARDLVQGLKYRDRTDLARWMGKWMVRAGFELLPDTELVIPVPLHRGRYFRRRFNQSAELARALAKLSGHPFRPEALIRRKATRQQVGLDREAREANVRAAFAVPRPARLAIEGRRILLVDDVLTTGATVASATKALLKGGASAVDVLTFARVLPGDFRAED
jgi:ComF family protein